MNLGQKVKAGNFIKYTKDMELILFNIRGRLVPYFLLVHLQRLMETELGSQKVKDIFFTNGHFWGNQVWDMIAKKMGYEKKYDKRMVFQANTEQSVFSGMGIITIKNFDVKNKLLVMHMDSVFAKEHKRIFGINKEGVDHEIVGVATAYGQKVFEGEEVVARETKCIAKGDKVCEFVITTKEMAKKYIKGDKLKYNLLKDFQKLGGKKQPYLDNTPYKTKK